MKRDKSVLTYAGVPPQGVFNATDGTPIVIDTTADKPYYLKGNTPTLLGGGGGGAGTVTSVAVSGGTTGLTTSGGPITASGTITFAGILAVASGGTGTSTPALVAGTNITITGSWPNQTIAASSGGGGLIYWTEGQNTTSPNDSSRPISWFKPVTALADPDVALIPRGVGSFMLSIPDNTNVGGNKRGQNAFDGQIARNAGSKVASGDFSAQFGENNTTSARDGFTVGSGNLNAATACSISGADNESDANADYSTMHGRQGKTRGIAGQYVHSAGLINVAGDGQYERIVQAGRNAGTFNVCVGGASASTKTILTCPNESAIHFICQVVGYQNSSNMMGQTITGVIYRSGGTIAFAGTPIVTGPFQIGASGWSITAALDGTNYGLLITVNNPSVYAEWTVVTHAALCKS